MSEMANQVKSIAALRIAYPVIKGNLYAGSAIKYLVEIETTHGGYSVEVEASGRWGALNIAMERLPLPKEIQDECSELIEAKKRTIMQDSIDLVYAKVHEEIDRLYEDEVPASEKNHGMVVDYLDGRLTALEDVLEWIAEVRANQVKFWQGGVLR